MLCDKLIKFQILNMIYANFFSPQMLSLLFCLHESTVQGEEKDPRNSTVSYLIHKILTLTQSSNICLTNESFEAQMLSVTNDIDFVGKYHEGVLKINSFNDFYRQVSKMLKTLRSLRNNKLEQGNLIDFLVRRMYIYFQKLDFKQIIKIYEQFSQYRNGEEVVVPQHQFMLTKSIEEIKFNLENYSPQPNPEELAKQVLELGEYDHTFKTSYLTSLIKSSEQIPIQSINSMHRYFDKSLGNLFQEKTEVNLMSNKINHCILSNALVNLRMHYLQECLQSISEGLRISQNNTDEQSINNCIIYLYKISEQLGKYEEQILLNEHAITHSLNLNNIVLMVYSCFNYSLFETKYNCSDPNIVLMKHRNINWTDALHFSRKKIYSTFESNCKNIYHTYRNLLIPTFMLKLSILIHLPQLTALFLNPYYQRKELYQLQIYKQFQGETEFDLKIKSILRYHKNNQKKLLYSSLQWLEESEELALSPLQIIKIRSTINKVKFQESNVMDYYNHAEQLIQFCHKYGFIKEELLQELVTVIKVLIRNELYCDSIVKVEQALQHAHEQKLKQYVVVCQLLKIQIYLHLQINVDSALSTLRQIEESSLVSEIRNDFKIVFYETKALANRKLHALFVSNINLCVECQQLKINELQSINQILNIYIAESNFVKVRSLLVQINDIALMNPTLMTPSKNDRIKATLSYVEKVLSNFATIDYTDYNEQELIDRIRIKIAKLYQSDNI